MFRVRNEHKSVHTYWVTWKTEFHLSGYGKRKEDRWIHLVQCTRRSSYRVTVHYCVEIGCNRSWFRMMTMRSGSAKKKTTNQPSLPGKFFWSTRYVDFLKINQIYTVESERAQLATIKNHWQEITYFFGDSDSTHSRWTNRSNNQQKPGRCLTLAPERTVISIFVTRLRPNKTSAALEFRHSYFLITHNEYEKRLQNSMWEK